MRTGMPLAHSIGSAGTAPGGARAASGVVLADGTSRCYPPTALDEASAALPEDLVRGVPLVDLAS